MSYQANIWCHKITFLGGASSESILPSKQNFILKVTENAMGKLTNMLSLTFIGEEQTLFKVGDFTFKLFKSQKKKLTNRDDSSSH